MRKLLLASAVVLASGLAVSGAHAANPAAGKGVYETNCAACHGPDGVAAIPGTPNFAKRERLEKPDGQLLNSIRSGLNIMPAWQGQLNDQEMASALAYIRTLAR
ncbi:MAG TPA: cytochrome c [Azospirillum sp.]|nr:cytochrome c [Azospirillum sp.]